MSMYPIIFIRGHHTKTGGIFHHHEQITNNSLQFVNQDSFGYDYD